MAVAARRETRMRVAEYRLWVEDRPDCERWELIDGEPLLMSPPRERHQMIVSNLIGSLRSLTRDGNCRALPGLAILSAAMDDFAPIPDVVVRCGPMNADGYASDLVLVAEVLSPSTMSTDRGRKVDFYRTVPSLRTFLIVYQDAARVELWRRDTAWTMRMLETGAAIDLSELGGTLSVADVYARVEF